MSSLVWFWWHTSKSFLKVLKEVLRRCGRACGWQIRRDGPACLALFGGSHAREADRLAHRCRQHSPHMPVKLGHVHSFGGNQMRNPLYGNALC